jgi:hypothetical protein
VSFTVVSDCRRLRLNAGNQRSASGLPIRSLALK